MVAYCREFINQVALEIVSIGFRNREHLFSVTLLPLRFYRQWNEVRFATSLNASPSVITADRFHDAQCAIITRECVIVTRRK